MIDAELADATLIVDALFGTGLDRAIEGTLADVVGALNDAGAPVVALDLPSGLDADTGAVLGVAVRAAATVTFAHRKLGLVTPRGAELAGDVTVAGLGLPDARVLEAIGVAARGIDARDLGRWLAPRPAGTHKHAAGDVLLVAGGAGTTGAALLAARGAMRAGAGLATIATFPEARAALEPRVVEIMTRAIDPDDVEGSLDALLARRSALVVGPGFGTDDLARRAVEHAVSRFEGLVVLDADGITCFAGRPEDLAAAPGELVLTPHPGELGRLLGRPSSEIEGDRFAAAQEAAARARAVVVLKGAHTIVASPGGDTWVALDRAPALATAGSGDVLAGLIAALAGGLAPAGAAPAPRSMIAAAAGVVIHARAAARWSEESGGADRGLLAGEIADHVPRVIMTTFFFP
jgi:NAD(P)H-hydrate epimerase